MINDVRAVVWKELRDSQLRAATALFATVPRRWRADLERVATEAGLDNAVVLVLLGTAILLVVNAGLLAVSSRLFRRPKLIRP